MRDEDIPFGDPSRPIPPPLTERELAQLPKLPPQLREVVPVEEAELCVVTVQEFAADEEPGTTRRAR